MEDGAGERLVVMLEARVSEFEKRMAKAENTGTNSYNKLRRGSRGATQQMEADMTRAGTRINQALASTSSQIGSFAKSFAVGFAGGAIAGIFAGITSSVNQTIGSLAQLGDEAKRAGVSVEAFQEWKFVAEQNRIGVDALTDGLKELNLRADEFVVTGGGSAKEAFERLGYSANELASKLKDPSALMLEIIGRLEGMDKAAQIRIADELFGGTGGEQFVQLLAQGEEGVQKTIDRARELGVVIDSDMIAKAQELDAKFAEVGAVIDNLWKRGVIGAAEFFGFINESLNDLLTEGEGREILGDEMFIAMSKMGSLSDEQVEKIRLLKGAYAEMGVQALDAADALVTFSQQLPEGKLQDELQAASTRLRELQQGFQDNEVSAQELHDGIEEVRKKTNEAVNALSDADKATFENVISNIGTLDAALLGPLNRAKELYGWLQKAAGAGAPAQSDSEPPPALSELAPTDGRGAKPAQLPGVDSQGDWEDARDKANKPKGGGKKGGKGSDRAITSLISDLMTPIENITAWHEEAMEVLNGATEAQLEALGGKNEAIERLEQEHADRLAAIDQAKNDQRLSEAGAFFGSMAAIAQLGGEKLAKVARVTGAAEALANTLVAQSQVLRDPKLGFWGKMAAYAAIGAAGFGVVASLKGGGGGGNGSTASAANTATAASSSPAADRNMYITVHGNMGRDSIVELFNQINSGLSDGFRLKGVEHKS